MAPVSGASTPPPSALSIPGVFVLRSARLVLQEGGPSVTAAHFQLGPAAAELPAVAFWTLPPPPLPPGQPKLLDAAVPDRRRVYRSFLLLPLNEVVDEHYTVYFCRLDASDGASPPAFCK